MATPKLNDPTQQATFNYQHHLMHLTLSVEGPMTVWKIDQAIKVLEQLKRDQVELPAALEKDRSK